MHRNKTKENVFNNSIHKDIKKIKMNKNTK